MRDLGIAVLREVGVDTGGCNIQFAVQPGDRPARRHRDEPAGVPLVARWRRKATGFPIAKIAAKLAIGYTLDEIPNDITLKTPAAFEPALDYVVVKIPRFAFEKFPGADPELTTTMKSVGEAMSLGRNFTEALNKAMRSMETKAAGLLDRARPCRRDAGVHAGGAAHPARRPALHRRAGAAARRDGGAGARGQRRHRPVVRRPDRRRWSSCAPRSSTRRCSTQPLLRRAKRAGLSDRAARRAAAGAGRRGRRAQRCGTGSGVRPVYKTVDTCAAEFAATTPYHYSTYDEETEVAPSDRPKVLILGSGPNRIGQGIEFDYSCVHAVQALREAGYETVMVNCNPETVSTDYDTADRLYFEPLTFEDVLEVFHAEDASGRAAGGPGVVGVIVQLGGQTPLGLAQRLKAAGRADRRHLARSRSTWPRTAARSARLLAEAGLRAPGARHRDLVRRGQGDRRRDRLPGAGPAVLRARRPGHGDRVRRRRRCATTSAGPPTSRRSTRCWSTGSSTTRSRSTSTRSCDADRRGLPRRRDGAHRGGRHPLRRLGLRAAADHARPAAPGRGAPLHRGDRPRRRRARPAQRPVRAQGRHALRAGGQPARVAHRAVRLQGDRGAAGQGGRPDHARRHHRRAARRGPAAGHRRRRDRCRPARRSRSRRRCCRSSGSAPRPARAWTACSARR